MRDKGGHSAHREPALLRIRRSSGLSNGLTRAREKEARCALPPSVSDAEAAWKRCRSGVEAVQKRCGSGAEAMRKRCRSDVPFEEADRFCRVRLCALRVSCDAVTSVKACECDCIREVGGFCPSSKVVPQEYVALVPARNGDKGFFVLSLFPQIVF